MAEPAKDADRLLAEARTGSREALGQALEVCRRYLLLIADRELDADLRAKGGASDLVQETFLEAMRDFPQFGGTSEPELRAWLRRLLLNNLAHFMRRYRMTHKRAVGKEVGLDGDGSKDGVGAGLGAGTPSPSAHAMAHEQAAALQQALGRLPEDYRQIIGLRYQEQHSFEEIGRLMNRSPDAARKLWARAMERFRQEWEGLP
jgi:RNA polymerase sigma-70 factor (ECF subfamily)